jgi:hypothetical protein
MRAPGMTNGTASPPARLGVALTCLLDTRVRNRLDRAPTLAAEVPTLLRLPRGVATDAGRDIDSLCSWTYESPHRLLDELDDDQLATAAELLRDLVRQRRPLDDEAAIPSRRQLSFIGRISAEPDLAERSAEILRR